MSHKNSANSPLYLVLISIHGLIRGKDLELGRDADTGGQTKYVVELARALGEREDVERVDLLTRRVVDGAVSGDYAVTLEALGPKAQIVRIDAGPEGYIAKEQLWDHLDSFADNVATWLREQHRLPDLLHSHYADAGYVGSRLANLLERPLVHTGHSLGRVKAQRLLAGGLHREEVERRYNMARRIEAEEDTLAVARMVIASTENEVEEQYGLYDHYQPKQMRVVPPGTDLRRLTPPQGNELKGAVFSELSRFLREPKRPLVLALSRPDERKNLATLVEAYGESEELQRMANLVIVAGNREDIRDFEQGARGVLTELLLLIDSYDLYGKVALPKHHTADQVSEFYRLAALLKGVFINPALTEPFGLTLIEAAASGLPIVATEDGGPRDIIRHCKNGFLVDPLDKEEIAKSLLKVLSNSTAWQRMATAGLRGVTRHYSWEAHAERYLQEIRPLIELRDELPPRPPLHRRRMLFHDRAIFTDLDQNLLGDPQSLADFVAVVRENRKCATFGIATGRSLESALTSMRRYGIPQPDILITRVGTEIYYSPQLTKDNAWERHIEFLWQPVRIKRLLAGLPGLQLQPRKEQSKYKISYYIDTQQAPCLEEIQSLLRQAELSVNIYLAFGQFLDVIPVRASKGFALRWYAEQWGIPLEHILAAGGSGADEDMMRGNTLAVVVANRHGEELSHLSNADRIYFAEHSYAAGILEAIEHYDFYGSCSVPREEEA